MKASKTDPAALHQQALEILQCHPWFRTASMDEISECIRTGRIERFHAKQYIIRAGTIHDNVILVINGILTTTTLNESGHRYISKLLHQGEITNIIPVIDRERVANDFVAKTTADLLFIKGSVFRNFIASNAHIKDELIISLCQRVRRYQSDIHGYSLSNLQSRCAQAILNLGDSQDMKKKDRTDLVFLINQGELADMLGYSRQSINKKLGELEQQGAIRKISIGKYEILDRKNLEAIASKRQK